MFATGFTNIKCKEAYSWVFQEFSKRCLANNVELPGVLLTSMEPDLLDSKTDAFPTSLHLISQYYLLSSAKDLLSPYKKRLDFDYLQTIDRFERLIQEHFDLDRFNRLQHEIQQSCDVLDPAAINEVRRFFEHRQKWSVLFYGGKIFTAGLHSNERAAGVDTFFKSQHKYEHTMLDMLELSKKLAQRECCLETNSKEAHSYLLHPLYRQMKERYSPYALSLMLHQMIESYKYMASE